MATFPELVCWKKKERIISEFYRKTLRESRRNLGEYPKYLGEKSKLLRDYLIEIGDDFRNNRG